MADNDAAGEELSRALPARCGQVTLVSPIEWRMLVLVLL